MARITETRQVQGFTSVEVRGYGNLHLSQNDDPSGPESLVIEADEQVMPKLKSEVRDGRLLLGFRMEWWEWITWWFTWITIADKSIHYRVTINRFDGASISGAGTLVAPRLRGEDCRLAISGSGEIRVDELTAHGLTTTISGSGKTTIQQLQAETVATTISGAGTIALSGTARRYQGKISGSGTVRTGELQAQEAEIHISGSGDVIVQAQNQLNVHISGSGTVRYVGQPNVSQHISGSGRVAPLSTG